MTWYEQKIPEVLPNTPQHIMNDKNLSTKRHSDDNILCDAKPSEAKKMKFSKNIAEGTNFRNNQIYIPTSPIMIGEQPAMYAISRNPNEIAKNSQPPRLEETSTTTPKKSNDESLPLRKVVDKNIYHINEDPVTIDVSQSTTNKILKGN